MSTNEPDLKLRASGYGLGINGEHPSLELTSNDGHTSGTSTMKASVPGDVASVVPIYDDVNLDYDPFPGGIVQANEGGRDVSTDESGNNSIFKHHGDRVSYALINSNVDNNTYDTSVSPNTSIPGVDTNERSPLLPKPATFKAKKQNSLLVTVVGWNNVLFLIVMLVALVIFGFKYVLYHAEATFNSISEFKIDNLELNEINNAGIVVSFDGDLIFNYSKIENNWSRKFYKSISLHVGEIDVKEIKQVDVSMGVRRYNGREYFTTLHKISTFTVLDSLKINLKHNTSKALSSSHIAIDHQVVDIFETGSSELLSELFTIYEKVDFALDSVEFDLFITARECNLNAAKGLYRSKRFSFDVDKLVKFDIDELKKLIGQSKYSMENNKDPLFLVDNDRFRLALNEILITNTTDNEVLLSLDLSYKFKTKSFPIQNLVLNEIIWELYIQDCNTQLVRLASLTTGKIELIDRENKNFKLHLSLPQLPHELVKPCLNSSGTSILSSWARKIFEIYDPNQILMVFANARNSNNPFWLDYILSSTLFPINSNFLKFYLPGNSDISNSILGMNFTGFEFHLPKQTNDKDIIPVVEGGNASINLALPDFLNDIKFDVPSFHGGLLIKYVDAELAYIVLPENQTLALSIDYLLRQIAVDMYLTNDSVYIKNCSAVNVFLTSLLSKQETKLTICPNVTFSLKNFDLLPTEESLEFQHISSSFDYNFVPNISVPDILGELMLEIDSLVYLSSTPDSIFLILNTKVFTPDFLFNKLSLLNYDNPIDLHFGYNGTSLGHSLIKDLNVNATEFYSNVSILIGLDPLTFTSNHQHNTKDEKLIIDAKVKDLLSKFISNEHPNIDITGHNNSFPASRKISESLDGLTVSFKLPEYNCPVYNNEPDEPFKPWPVPFIDKYDISNGTFNSSLKQGASSLPSWLDFWKLRHTEDTNGFILLVTMHIMTSEIELEVYNPILNMDVEVTVKSGRAIYKTDDGEEIDLAHVKKNTYLKVPPGIYTTPRLPINYETGAAADILRKALNRNLNIESKANFNVKIGHFDVNLDYHGSGQTAIIRL